MGTVAPTNFLICDGTVYNIADYPLLANHFTAQFGSVSKFGGDGATTFAVPDLRGEFLRGTGTNGHTWTDKYGISGREGSGASVGSHQSATQHTAIWSNDTRTIVVDGLNGPMPQSDSSVHGVNIQTRVSTNAAQANNMVTFFTSRPTNTSVLYCIRYQ